nr:Chain E, Spike protein S1 [Severe acute respiratory syndrome coronavirus 2]7JJC_F Chain F, Spike protein S1 [Severe acute respiratory syndrome coronavirus 2]7JJC_G Chain G, Spike protein S1 [Severe acute respiratory syndrome coronavirus 2]7JJC_H Chain H, Spike protein S1 [Severe acute respiratory syndrome coronavirus 2]
NSPRRAR